MADFDKRNTYSIFINENAQGKQPYIKGFFTDTDGKEWEMPAWESVSKQGKTYYSGRLQEKYVKPEGQSGYDSFKNSRPQPTKTSNSPSVDVPLEDISDAPIDLSEIPF